MKIVEVMLEVIGWLQIVVGITVAAGLIAFLIYFIWTNDSIEIVAGAILAIGFMLGVVVATRIWKKHGTTAWLSSIRRIK